MEEKSAELYEFKPAAAIGQTDKALHVNVKGVVFWCPQTVVHDDSEVYKKGHKGKLVLKGWWVEKNGWAYLAGVDKL